MSRTHDPPNENIGARIRPHQVEGVRFMWGEIVGAKEGCLLAHTMGLGKTMQCITLLVTIAEASRNPDERVHGQIPEALRQSRTIILCPPSLLENWCDELLMWVPTSAKDSVGEIRMVTSALPMEARMFELKEWNDHGGILLLPYSLLRRFVSKARPEKETDPALAKQDYELACRILFESPSIVIADEAQTFKGKSTKVSECMHRFHTKSRIALTGSPLSNNLDEYFSLVNWVQENYLGDRSEFRYKFVEPITDGLYQDSSQYAKRKSLTKLSILTADLAPKIHRADYSAMKGQMKGKTDFIVKLSPTTLQEKCYQLFVSSVIREGFEDVSQSSLWAWLSILRLLCNHPSCLYAKLTGKDTNTGSKQFVSKQKASASLIEDAIGLEADELLSKPIGTLGLDPGMVEKQLELLSDAPDINGASLSAKMEVLMKILDYARESKEKVLVFSHTLPTLNYVQKKLIEFNRKYIRLDGTTNPTSRQQLTKDFNTGRVEVLLISTRAGGTGLNLQAASRVVILDDSFNPMHEQQAIGRAYRIGQQRHVYVYRLMIAGSFEEALLNQALLKLQLSTRVVDKKETIRLAKKGLGQYIVPLKDQVQEDLDPLVGKDPLIMDRILDLQSEPKSIRSIQLAETFLEEETEELTAEEQREVAQHIELERLRRTDKHAYDARLRELDRTVLLESTGDTIPTNNLEAPIHAAVGPVMFGFREEELASAAVSHNPLPSETMSIALQTPDNAPVPEAIGELIQPMIKQAETSSMPTTKPWQNRESVNTKTPSSSMSKRREKVNDALRTMPTADREQYKDILRTIAEKKIEQEGISTSTTTETHATLARKIVDLTEGEVYGRAKSREDYSKLITSLRSLIEGEESFRKVLKVLEKNDKELEANQRRRKENIPRKNVKARPSQSAGVADFLSRIQTPDKSQSPSAGLKITSRASPIVILDDDTEDGGNDAGSIRPIAQDSPIPAVSSDPALSMVTTDGAADSAVIKSESESTEQPTKGVGETRVGSRSPHNNQTHSRPFSSLSTFANFPALHNLLRRNTADRRR